MIVKPLETEYNPFYQPYMNQLHDSDVLVTLKKQLKSVPDFLWQIPKAKHDFAYVPGKWTIKELMQHINDTERVFTYRALCFARGDRQDMPAMDQDVYLNNAAIAQRPFSSFIDEFVSLRVATICLFENITEDQQMNMGNASGFPVSVRALAAMTAGHVAHHISIINSRYL
ncbi:DinB family protein [Roseivirga pacifica]|uniref:DinB family protein n=1 Tax=Roseivirga pacifica TaxID=1267423 RepID=UPI003BA9D1B2